MRYYGWGRCKIGCSVGAAKSAARHVSNTTCAVEWYHDLGSPRGRAKAAFSIAPERTELLPMKNGNVPPLCHSDGRASGVEESTTLDNEPPQDKPSYLGRFLDSLRSLGMTCTMGSTSAPIVSTTYNAAPPLIHRLRAVPLPRWGRSFWSFPGAFPTSFNGRTEMTNVGPPNNCQLSIVHCQFGDNCPLSTVNSPRVPANRTTAADTASFPGLPDPCGPIG